MGAYKVPLHSRSSTCYSISMEQAIGVLSETEGQPEVEAEVEAFHRAAYTHSTTRAMSFPAGRRHGPARVRVRVGEWVRCSKS